MMFTGGCACGAVRYECTAEPTFMANCHCRACQRASGVGHSSVLIVAADHLRVTQGTPRAYTCKGDSGADVHRSFCADCGSPLFSRGDVMAGFIGIKPASLDDPSWFRPAAEVWVRSAQPWSRLDPDLPHFERLPERG